MNVICHGLKGIDYTILGADVINQIKVIRYVGIPRYRCPTVTRIVLKSRETSDYDTLKDNIEFTIYQRKKIVSFYQCVRLMEYPSLAPLPPSPPFGPRPLVYVQ